MEYSGLSNHAWPLIHIPFQNLFPPSTALVFFAASPAPVVTKPPRQKPMLVAREKSQVEHHDRQSPSAAFLNSSRCVPGCFHASAVWVVLVRLDVPHQHHFPLVRFCLSVFCCRSDPSCFSGPLEPFHRIPPSVCPGVVVRSQKSVGTPGLLCGSTFYPGLSWAPVGLPFLARSTCPTFLLPGAPFPWPPGYLPRRFPSVPSLVVSSSPVGGTQLL